MLKMSTVVAWGAFVILSVGCSQSDVGITTAVKARFAADHAVKAYQIDVDTQSGVVTLSGTVENAAAEEQAVRLARETEGVANVVNRLTVNPADTLGSRANAAADALGNRVDDAITDVANTTSDAAITAAVKSKMMVDVTVSALQINVDTTDGVVTLTGTVRSAGERDRAIAVARGTGGVKSVEDKIVVKS